VDSQSSVRGESSTTTTEAEYQDLTEGLEHSNNKNQEHSDSRMEVNQPNNRSETDQPILNPTDNPILDQGSVVGHPEQSSENIPKT
jgi:hypothetical protein